ncbi:MAG: ferrochelatase [Simkaniaceae bacterium]|nr:ferrochelatase [Simkaniaceae bacterium]
MTKTLLLVNLGTPKSPSNQDVKSYLHEFLLDPRVVDLPWIKRQLLVRGIIVPRRYRESASSYRAIWQEEGSPLLVYGKQVQGLLQKKLGSEYRVELAMRYGSPSIPSALKPCKELTVLPLFPQYASATSGSVQQKVMESIQGWQTIPKLKIIDHFYDHPKMIEAFAARAPKNLDSYDHILFSFHGLPVRQLKKAHKECKMCTTCSNNCYYPQCYATAKAIAKRLNTENYTVCFQSRLGKDPWIQPYASDVIEECAKKGMKNLLVFSPAFICDCLETIFEIGVEYQKEFQDLGGESIDLVPGLNDHPLWIEALAEIATS